METIIVELRAGEGGKDASLLVRDLADVYRRAAKVESFSFLKIQEREGYISLCL
jgi:protein subunit release factor A